VIEVVGRRALRHAKSTHVRALHQLVVALKTRNDLVFPGADLPHRLVERALLWRDAVVQVVGFVVRDVHVEAAVAIHVRHRDRCAALPRRIEAEVAMLGEVAFAVVEKNRIRTGGREQDEIERAVAVDVGECGAGRVPVTRADARGLGDVLELPIAAIAVERAASLGLGEEDVGQSVAVHIAESNPRSLAKIAIADEQGFAHGVLELNPALGAF